MTKHRLGQIFLRLEELNDQRWEVRYQQRRTTSGSNRWLRYKEKLAAIQFEIDAFKGEIESAVTLR